MLSLKGVAHSNTNDWMWDVWFNCLPSCKQEAQQDPLRNVALSLLYKTWQIPHPLCDHRLLCLQGTSNEAGRQCQTRTKLVTEHLWPGSKTYGRKRCSLWNIIYFRVYGQEYAIWDTRSNVKKLGQPHDNPFKSWDSPAQQKTLQTQNSAHQPAWNHKTHGWCEAPSRQLLMVVQLYLVQWFRDCEDAD